MTDDFLKSEESQQFFGLVQMLQRSAMVAMGQLPDQEGKFSVNLAEAKAIKEKEDLLQAQASPISLDPESGLQIIDIPEKEEPLEEPELIKR